MSSIDPQAKHIAYKEWKELGVQLELLAEMVATQSKKRYALQKILKEIIKEQDETHALLFTQANKLTVIIDKKSEELEALIGDDWDEVDQKIPWEEEGGHGIPVDRGGEGPLSCAMTGEQ